MTDPRPTRQDTFWYPAAGFLMLAGPVWGELQQSRYPLSTPEAVVLPLAAGAVGAVLGWLAGKFREPFRTVGFLVLALGFLDLQFNLERQVHPAFVAAGTLGVITALRGHRGLLTVVCLAALYLSGLVPTGGQATATGPTPAATGSRPTLLHVVLDGQWGPNGLRAAGDSATAMELDDFYRSRGFRVYQGAYSRYSATRLSLGGVTALGDPPPVAPAGAGSYRLTANRYFDTLAARGYRIAVFQTSHLDYCPPADPEGPATGPRCRAASAASVGNVGYLAGRWQPRAIIALRFFLGIRSSWYVRLFGAEPVSMRRSSAGRAVVWAETVRRAIAAREADAYFVHLLLPHPPFEVDADCVGYSTVRQRLAVEADTSLRAKLAAYGGQTRCAHRLVARLIATLDSVAGPNAIVIAHGDHGPKLVGPGKRIEDYSPAALSAYYSTLFAVRAPGLAPGLVGDPVAIQNLVRRLVASDFTAAAPDSEPPFVFATTGEDGDGPRRTLEPDEMLWVRRADLATAPGPRRP